MKPSQIILTVLAFALGAALIAGIGAFSNGDDADMEAKLAAAEAQIEKLKSSKAVKTPFESKLTSTLPSAIAEKVETVSELDTEEEEVPQEGPQAIMAAIAKLAQSAEGKSVMKTIGSSMRQGMVQGMESTVDGYVSKLNLNDAQADRLKSRLTEKMNTEFAAFDADMESGEMSMQEAMMKQRDMRKQQESEMNVIIKEELTDDQWADYEREQLVEKTERVQRDSDRELSRLDRDLNLTETQEDQVFGILVQTNSEYDGSMAIEGADASVNVGEDQAKDEAIRSVLDAEQAVKYDKSQEQRQNRRGGWGGGGFGR
ncbi:MAG: ribosomal protein S20 [Verrucomicrobiales bacterium]|jgi:ribosomal protein S20